MIHLAWRQFRVPFAIAMSELALPATFFQASYRGKALPGVFLRNAAADAPDRQAFCELL